MVTSRGFRGFAGRGFSLIELLVVMFIIGLVVAITIPALGYARTLAKKTTTQTFMTGLSQACAVFQNDNRRVPGYFSPREMGSMENIAAPGTGGFTAMDNVLLDLAGGVTTAAVGPTIFAVGPTASGKVNVDIDKIGVASGSGKLYWAPDMKFYEAQLANSKVGDPVNLNLKSVIDSFGQPLLFWANDDASIAPVTLTNPERFANDSSGVGGSTPSKFYWASNSAYLSASALGRRALDQSRRSIFGASEPNKAKHVTAYLGNPSAIANPAEVQRDTENFPLYVPSAGRGKFMIQSAGSDAIYLSREESGFKKNGGLNGANFHFGKNFPPAATRASDVASEFDDLLVSGGN